MVTPEERRSQSAATRQRNRRSTATKRSVVVTLTHAGDLLWSSQDIGPDVGRLRRGAIEYEWWRTVPARYVPALLAALGGGPADDVVALVAQRFDSDVELEKFATSLGIPTEFDSWTSTNND